MLLAVTTDDLGFMWVAVEGTTLASVFLVNFERTRASLEASYKYVLICSVGIAVAFLGTVLVYFADVCALRRRRSRRCGGRRCRASRPACPPRIVEMAFVFLLVGYGTKAGLAPMHTWLPDAHSEAPGAGERDDVGRPARHRRVRDPPLQADRRRRRRPRVRAPAAPRARPRLDGGGGRLPLEPRATTSACCAYSSVEHLGLVSLGLGFGGPWGIAGAILHIANHALAKSVLFLLAGRIRPAYASIEIEARARAARPPARERAAVLRGDAGAHGPAAVRTLRQRGDDLRRGLRGGPTSRPRSIGARAPRRRLRAALLRTLQRMLLRGARRSHVSERCAWAALPLRRRARSCS